MGENRTSVAVMAKSLSDWTMCCDASEIDAVIPMKNDDVGNKEQQQIPVMFARSIDPQKDSMSEADLQIQREQVMANEDVVNEAENESDDDEIMESEEDE